MISPSDSTTWVFLTGVISFNRGLAKGANLNVNKILISLSPLIHVRSETNDVSLPLRGAPQNKDTRITLKMSLKRDNTQTQTTCFVHIGE